MFCASTENLHVPDSRCIRRFKLVYPVPKPVERRQALTAPGSEAQLIANPRYAHPRFGTALGDFACRLTLR